VEVSAFEYGNGSLRYFSSGPRANRSRHSSHVMRASQSLALAALGEAVDSPILKDPADQDLAVEVLFFLLPCLVTGSVLRLAWSLVRGPRRDPVRWYGSLLTGGAFYLFAVSLFDFYDRTAVMSPPLLVVVTIGLVLHRKKLDWPSRTTWRDKNLRRDIFGQLIAAGLLSFVSPNTARLWLAAFVGCEGLLLHLLVGRSRRRIPAAARQPPGRSEAA
jgi:hypothetical protein